MNGLQARIGALAVAFSLLTGGAMAFNTPLAAAASPLAPDAGIAAPSIFRLQQMPRHDATDNDVETNDDHDGATEAEEPGSDVGEQETGDVTHDGVDCLQEGQHDGENAGC